LSLTKSGGWKEQKLGEEMLLIFKFSFVSLIFHKINAKTVLQGILKDVACFCANTLENAPTGC
jgi:hypothetical protein